MKELTKEEKFVCTMIWGCIPIDILFVRNSKLFQAGMIRFEKGEWKEFWAKENKN